MTVSLIAWGMIASRSLSSACDGGIARLSDGEIEGLWLKYTGQCNIISVGDMEANTECVCVWGGGANGMCAAYLRAVFRCDRQTAGNTDSKLFEVDAGVPESLGETFHCSGGAHMCV